MWEICAQKLSAMLPNTAPLAVPRVAFEQDPPVKDGGSTGLQPGEICDSMSGFSLGEPRLKPVPESDSSARLKPCPSTAGAKASIFFTR